MFSSLDKLYKTLNKVGLCKETEASTVQLRKSLKIRILKIVLVVMNILSTITLIAIVLLVESFKSGKNCLQASFFLFV